MWAEGRSCKAQSQVTHAGLQFRRIYKPLLERVYGSSGTGGGGRNVHRSGRGAPTPARLRDGLIPAARPPLQPPAAPPPRALGTGVPPAVVAPGGPGSPRSREK